MKFTIAPELLIRTLQLVGEARSSRPSSSLPAGQDRIGLAARRCNPLSHPSRSAKLPTRSVRRRSGAQPAESFRLSASRDRLSVQTGQTAAEIETAVWEDGTCIVSYPHFLAALEQQRHQPCLTVEVSSAGLRVGHTKLPVLSYSASSWVPETSQIFFATDFGVVPSPNVTERQVASARDW